MTGAPDINVPWTWSPAVIAACGAATAVYVAVFRSRFSARSCYFVAALLVVVLALLSPLGTLAAGYVFSAHMLQHMLLLLVAPLLVVLALPAATDSAGDRDARRLRLHPLFGWFGGVGAMWIWHERTLCQLATQTAFVRGIQVISLLALGTLFWWPLLARREADRIAPLVGVAYLFTACIACSALGIFIAFSPVEVCPSFLHPPSQPALLHLIRDQWGITPAKDQEIGGLLMWLPGCGIYLAGTMALLARWYGAPESDA